MRRTPLLLLLAGLATAGLAPAASANPYCEDVAGIPRTGFGPVCTVRCAQQYDPSVELGRDPSVDLGRPSCMDEDA